MFFFLLALARYLIGDANFFPLSFFFQEVQNVGVVDDVVCHLGPPFRTEVLIPPAAGSVSG